MPALKYICVNGSCKTKYPCVIRFDKDHEGSMRLKVENRACLLFRCETAHWEPLKKTKRSKKMVVDKSPNKPFNRFREIEMV